MGSGFEDLDVYKRAFGLQRPIHDIVRKFPDFEKYDLASQMRRACKSVVSNIVEGYSRHRSAKELCSYLAVSLGSAGEMQAHIATAFALDYMTEDDRDHFTNEYAIIGKQLTRLIQYWRRKQ